MGIHILSGGLARLEGNTATCSHPMNHRSVSDMPHAGSSMQQTFSGVSIAVLLRLTLRLPNYSTAIQILSGGLARLRMNDATILSGSD